MPQPTVRVPNTTLLRDPDMMRARAALMLTRRLHGASYTEIAAEFRVSTDTVERALSLARRAGMITKFEDEVLSDLVPLAIGQFKKAITEGDTAAALEVLKATGLLLKPLEKAQPKLADVAAEFTLADYIAKLRSPDVPVTPVLEGELVRAALSAPTSEPTPAQNPPADGPPSDANQLPDPQGSV